MRTYSISFHLIVKDLQNLSVILSNIHNYINMARSKATARKPKGSTDNQKEIKGKASR